MKPDAFELQDTWQGIHQAIQQAPMEQRKS
jgi:hypothetical protein